MLLVFMGLLQMVGPNPPSPNKVLPSISGSGGGAGGKRKQEIEEKYKKLMQEDQIIIEILKMSIEWL